MASPITVPALGESVTEATVAKWFKAVGEVVTSGEPLVELETDKVTVEVPAPASGVLASIDAVAGSNVGVGALLGSVDAKAGAQPAPPPPKPVAAETAPVAEAMGLSPAVKRLVEENKLDPASIPASGKDGRLTKEDVVNHLEKKTAVPAPAAPAPVATTPAAPRASQPNEERVRMSRLRKRIAERLKEAQNTAAMLTTFNEVDMSALMTIRNQYKDSFEKKHGVRIGFMSFFVKAAIAGLKEFPAVNGEIDGDELVYKNHYDIGVAVGTPQGLVVPVVRGADKLSFAEVEKTIGELGKKARDGKLALEDLSGGTFTISNGGVYGSLMSTPILNPPQSGILGMHKIQERPMVVGGQIIARPMMYLALSYDHRIIDGREAVSFLVRVKECIEDPQRILLDL
ncbi:MAG: 2-oxoglutarate dehydrogenase complex dihydrolipoyllysine-residue succinyltransferase [Alphaproteobacteria bacterium]|nr:2-oxoglutarate dehydrogenase complex dihydrolipoyllysine-residue succinyltransferase [Alphaproteobacteria bacterium]